MASRGGQKIILVSGKGGVGKSACAAACARAYAKQGQKTLLVELGERSFYRYVFGIAGEQEPVKVQENLFLARWEGAICLREYLLHYLRIERLVDMFFDNNIMRALVQAAPALRELAILGKITSGIRGVGPALDFDCIVVDAFSTGHFKALLRAPVGMLSAIGFGPMGEQSRGIIEVVRNPSLTEVKIVCVAEELPVSETQELASFVQKEFGQRSEIWFNRLWQPGLSAQDLSEIQSSLAQQPELADFGRFVQKTLSAQEKYQGEFAGSWPVKALPLVFADQPLEVIESLAEYWI